jgi:hypothetical protein
MLSMWKLLTLPVRICTLAGGGGLFGGGGDGGGSSTTTSDIPEWLKPYVTFGLEEAQNLYKAQGPDYYPYDTYVPASQTTLSALQSAEQRAAAGSPLVTGAQQQMGDVIGGKYLQNNPYFNQVMAGAGKAASREFYDALQGITSGASQAGRYGSGAMTELQSRASQNLADTLANKAAEMSYSNFAAERARQDAAVANAPAMAAADYADAEKMLQIGQIGEDYSSQKLASDIERFNYGQNLPYQKLSAYLGSVYGAPVPISQATETSSGGGGKIICTAMNEMYGFGSFRNAVWLKYSKDKLKKEHEVGYHAMFLPLVKISYKMGNKWWNKAVRAVLEHLVKHRTADIWLEAKGKKRDNLGRIYRKIFEPLCYLVGKIKGVK